MANAVDSGYRFMGRAIIFEAMPNEDATGIFRDRCEQWMERVNDNIGHGEAIKEVDPIPVTVIRATITPSGNARVCLDHLTDMLSGEMAGDPLAVLQAYFDAHHEAKVAEIEADAERAVFQKERHDRAMDDSDHVHDLPMVFVGGPMHGTRLTIRGTSYPRRWRFPQRRELSVLHAGEQTAMQPMKCWAYDHQRRDEYAFAGEG